MNLVDVIAGDGPPPILVCELIRGLPDDSMTHALRQGGMQFLGWGTDRHIAASTFDAVSVGTVASGNWKGKPPKPPTYPRPTIKDAVKKTKATVADLFAKMSRKYGSREG